MRHRKARSAGSGCHTSQLLEHLESRVLLDGLTVITHGYEPFSNSRPSWIDSMGHAIAQVAGSTTSIYALRLEATNSTTVHVSQFTRLSGPLPSASSNGEVILLLDWASVSGILTQTYSVSYLASVVTPYLTQPDAAIGLIAPLAQGSIQLIGHSRGAPFVSEIAKDLGQSGIWVDQVTTLDPVPSPFNSDPSVTLRSNVIFADNYYQNSGDGFLVPNGSRVTGAVNFGPLSLGGGYSSLDGGSHNNVHLFYQGTIGSSTGDGSYSVSSSWYPGNNVARATTGFYYSRLGGGVRPASGISSAFGGTASRSSVTRSGDQWPNLAFVTPSITNITAGDAFSTTFKYQDYNASSTIQWFLDPDSNPYNGNSITLGNATNFSATGNTVASDNVSLTASAPTGTYYLEGLITNGSETRYAYTGQTIAVTATPAQLAFVQPPATGIAGQPFNPPLSVAIEDADGNLTNDNSSVTLSLITGQGGGTLTGNLTVQADNGIATFTGVALSAVGNYALQATDGNLTLATTGTITVTPPPPHLSFTQQPASGITNLTLSSAITVTLIDSNGQTLTGDNSIVTLTVASGPGGGALKGTLTAQAQNGVATFNNLFFTKPGSYTLQASDGNFTSAISPAILLTMPQTHLVFIQQPTATIAGQTIAPAITVAVEDASNQIVASDTSLVSLAILSGPTGTGGTFDGTLSVHAVNGIATFNDLSLTRAGNYTFLATDGALTGAHSHLFTISPDTSSAHLVLLQTADSTIVGKPLSPSIIVTVEDQFTNLIKTDHSQVSLSIVSGPTDSAFGGSSTVTVSSGNATFKTANLTLAGNYTLAAADSSLPVAAPVQFAQVITPGTTTFPIPHLASSYPFGITTISDTLKSTAGSAIPFTGIASLFDQDNNLLGTATLTSAGLAAFTMTNLPLGNYVGTITYPGDLNHSAATSSSFKFHIVAATTTTTLTPSASPLVSGQALTLTATVNAASAPNTPRTGAVTFMDGSTTLATVPLDANSSAFFTIPTPTLGTHNYSASYSGDSTFNASRSPRRTIIVKKDNTLATLTSSATAPVAPGDIFTLTAVITVLAPGSGTATGTVVFKDGAKILGTASLDITSTATLTTSLTIRGAHKLTAIYSGDTLSASTTSAILTVNVLAPLTPALA